MTKFVLLGSANRAKIVAAQVAFGRVLGCEFIVNVQSVEVPSGVSDQPMSDEECIAGAQNRALAAADLNPSADFTVGLEGGLVQVADTHYQRAWAVVLSPRTGKMGIGSSASFPVPEHVLMRVRRGLSMSDACDEVFDTVAVGQGQGYIGLATCGRVNRSAALADAIIAAYSVFNHPDLF